MPYLCISSVNFSGCKSTIGARICTLKEIKHAKTNPLLLFNAFQIVGVGQILVGGLLIWDHLGYNLIVSKSNLILPSIFIFLGGPLSLLLCWMGCSATYSRKKWFMLFVSKCLFIRSNLLRSGTYV